MRFRPDMVNETLTSCVYARRMTDRFARRQGFTLIELSIVLVIIGLIVGGILVGRDLVRSAELRAAISNISGISTAIHSFQIKYNCLPGDCPNATDYFGYDSTCYDDLVSHTGTCNGNGDGNYSPWPQETQMATQHLAMAQLWKPYLPALQYLQINGLGELTF